MIWLIKLILLAVLLIGNMVVLLRGWPGWLLIWAALGLTDLFWPKLVLGLTPALVAIIVGVAVELLAYLARTWHTQPYGASMVEVTNRWVAGAGTGLMFGIFLGPVFGIEVWWLLIGHHLFRGRGKEEPQFVLRPLVIGLVRLLGTLGLAVYIILLVF